MIQQRKRNYQRELEKIIEEFTKEGRIPRLLLHSCCAPCSSYVLEYLSEYFQITDYYYNPNITEEVEYRKRSEELRRITEQMPFRHPVHFVEGRYEPERFFEAAAGLSDCPEGGERCLRCFRLRLFETARMAAEWEKEESLKEQGPFDFITTTLTISPLKNAEALNTIGEEAAEQWGVAWLPSDFKKKGGYQRSIELSKEYELYRQNYCGCVFSRRST